MRRRDGQIVDERRVQDPKEVAESFGAEVWPEIALLRGQGKGAAEELDVVAFVRRPYPDAGVDVLGEIDHDAGEVVEHIGRQAEGVVGEIALHVRERPPELPHDLGKVRVASSLVAVGAMRQVVRHDLSFL